MDTGICSVSHFADSTAAFTSPLPPRATPPPLEPASDPDLEQKSPAQGL